MRYIMGRVRAMHRHTPAELDSIALELLQVRMCFHLARQDWLQHVPPIFIGFHGFATDFERSVFLRVLKHATKPRVLHSTFQQSGAFEGFAVLHPTTAAADAVRHQPPRPHQQLRQHHQPPPAPRRGPRGRRRQPHLGAVTRYGFALADVLNSTERS